MVSKSCKFGDKICYSDGDINFLKDCFFIGTPCRCRHEDVSPSPMMPLICQLYTLKCGDCVGCYKMECASCRQQGHVGGKTVVLCIVTFVCLSV